MAKKNEKLPIGGNENASLQLLKAALDSAVTGIIITDNQLPDNPIIYANEAFLDLSGYQRDELIGRNCRFLQGNERDQPAREQIRQAVSEGKSIVVEIRNYRRNGNLFWNELHISPISNERGEVSHFIGVQNDITRRKAAEDELIYERNEIEKKIQSRTKELRENQDYLEGVVQTIRQGLLVLGPNLQVISANDFFLKSFKVNKRDTVGQSLYHLGNGQWNIPQLRTLLEQILPTNNPVLDFEVEHDFPHIGKKLMLLNAHRIELEGTYKDRILLAIEDITEYRAAEIRKDDFLSVASHELKTPLTTIKGYNQTLGKLLQRNDKEKSDLVVSKMANQIERLHKIIQDLLEMSKIQTKNLSLNLESTDLLQLINETVADSRSMFPSHKIKIEGTISRKVKADESQVSQVLHNLISNAIKYSPDAAEIKIFLSEVSDFAKVAVTDYGMGISVDDQKRIFDRFYRASNTQKHFPGMGVGLYISEQIIEKHGGSLWVDSDTGKGATFSFTLPIAVEEGNDE